MGFDVAADSAALFVIRLAFEGLPTSGFPLSVRLSLGLSPANHRDLLTPDDPLYLAQGCLDSLSFEFFFFVSQSLFTASPFSHLHPFPSRYLDK